MQEMLNLFVSFQRARSPTPEEEEKNTTKDTEKIRQKTLPVVLQSWLSLCPSCPLWFIIIPRGPFPILRDEPLPYDFLTFLIFSVRAGTTSKRLPTIPKLATRKIGARESLFTATMSGFPLMPPMCWNAPLIPSAR